MTANGRASTPLHPVGIVAADLIGDGALRLPRDLLGVEANEVSVGAKPVRHHYRHSVVDV